MREYVYGNYIDEPLAMIAASPISGVYYYQQVANYNVMALINDAGVKVEGYIYDPYGRTTGILSLGRGGPMLVHRSLCRRLFLTTDSTDFADAHDSGPQDIGPEGQPPHPSKNLAAAQEY